MSADRRSLRLVALAALLVWLAVTLPLALGAETLYLRDVFSAHLPSRAFGARELAAGRIPAIRPDWGLGQPFRGNPNSLAFYPGNLLYLLLPLWSAFNLHYMLHWLLAFFTFRVLARELGFAPAPAFLAALTYAGSGWMLSNLTFYNLLTVAAWWPLAIWGAVRGGRCGVTLGGLACGLALLGGEPVTAALGLLPLVWLGVERHGLRRGVALSVTVGVLGLGVALPQLVATARVVGFSWRGLYGPGVAPDSYTLHPLRWIELLVPLPFGQPGGLGAEAFVSRVGTRGLPWVLSLHVGVTALALAGVGVVRKARWGIPVALGLALAWAGGWIPNVLSRLSLGLFRYPEKFLFWFAVFVPLLAAAGLESVAKADPSAGKGVSRWRGWRPVIPVLMLTLVGLAMLLAVVVWGPAMAVWLTADRPAGTGPSAAGLQARWLGGLLLSVGLLLATALAVRRRAVGALLLFELLGLLPLLGLVRRDSTAFYREPAPWAASLPSGTSVFPADWDWPVPSSRRQPAYTFERGQTVAGFLRAGHLDLDYPTGVLAGLSYPLAPDIEGLHSPHLHRFLQLFPFLSPEAAGRWLRTLGLEVVTAAGKPPAAGLVRVATVEHFGVATSLYRVEGAAPRVWWPDEVETVASMAEVLERVAAETDPVARVRVLEPVDHHPGARVATLEETPDRVVLEVEGEGGLVVLRRSYRPIYRAFCGDREERELAVVPVNVLLLGIVVPPGRQRVTLEVSAWPEVSAGVVAIVLAAAALVVGWRSREPGSRRPRDSLAADPATARGA